LLFAPVALALIRGPVPEPAIVSALSEAARFSSLKCPECERLLQAQKEARLTYESTSLLFKSKSSGLPPTPAEKKQRAQDSDLRKEAYLRLQHANEELTAHQASHLQTSN
jgi:hypothetical protein